MITITSERDILFFRDDYPKVLQYVPRSIAASSTGIYGIKDAIIIRNASYGFAHKLISRIPLNVMVNEKWYSLAVSDFDGLRNIYSLPDNVYKQAEEPEKQETIEEDQKPEEPAEPVEEAKQEEEPEEENVEENEDIADEVVEDEVTEVQQEEVTEDIVEEQVEESVEEDTVEYEEEEEVVEDVVEEAPVQQQPQVKPVQVNQQKDNRYNKNNKYNKNKR